MLTFGLGLPTARWPPAWPHRKLMLWLRKRSVRHFRRHLVIPICFRTLPGAHHPGMADGARKPHPANGSIFATTRITEPSF